MRRVGRLRPVASYHWSDAQRSTGPFGRARTHRERFVSTVGDALRFDAKRPRLSKLVGADWRTSALRSSGATHPDRRVRRGASLAQIWGRFGSADSMPKQFTSWIFCSYALRAYGLCGQIWPQKILAVDCLDIAWILCGCGLRPYMWLWAITIVAVDCLAWTSHA
jgi:hypothetical protein